jgi:hypothetical protein
VVQAHPLLHPLVLFLLVAVKVLVIHMLKITVVTVGLVVAQEAVALKESVTHQVNLLLEVMALQRLLIKVLMVGQA